MRDDTKAVIMLRLTPREFDLLREAVKDLRERANGHDERTADLDQLLDKVN